MHVSQDNAGKVQVRQDVLAKFGGFSYQKFGAVREQTTAIVDGLLKDSVSDKDCFDNRIETTYGKSVAFKTGMVASADVITKDTRLVPSTAESHQRAVINPPRTDARTHRRNCCRRGFPVCQ